jgi:hypothetical protein
MNYKKIDMPMDSVPNYNLSDLFAVLISAGYTIENGYVSATEPTTEDDYRIIWAQFMIHGVPILRTLPGQTDPIVLSGTATVMIAAVESVYPDLYYVEDIIMSTFRTESDVIGYTSFMISDTLHALVKSFVTIYPSKLEETVEEAEPLLQN